jgi:hypothetical protein
MRSTAAAAIFYHAACARDLEGIVGNWAGGMYQTDGQATKL